NLAARATARAVARPAPERGTARGGGVQRDVGPVRVGLGAVSGTVDSRAGDGPGARTRDRDTQPDLTVGLRRAVGLCRLAGHAQHASARVRRLVDAKRRMGSDRRSNPPARDALPVALVAEPN